jgi:hypothetical protein
VSVTRRFGDRATFAVEVGQATSPDLRVVDLWAGGKWLTTDDNTAFLPQFCRVLRSDGARVFRRGIRPCPFPGSSPQDVFRQLDADQTEFRERYWFMDWGPTVDNTSRYAYLDGDELVIVFTFWREGHRFPEELGKVFVARIHADEFSATVVHAADFMDAERSSALCKFG